MTQAVDCAYAVEGQGPPLFLIHGVGARGQTWAPVVAQLKSSVTCITYDLRGHGDSPKPQGSIGLDELVADLEALRARLGIAQAHMFGHSLGGMIAPAYARAYPDRVLSIGLLSTAAFRTAEDSARIRGVVAALRAQGIVSLIDGFVGRWFTEPFLRDHADLVEGRKRQVLATDPELFANVFQLYAETEMGPWLHEIAAPALVLTGEHDLTCSPRLNKQIAAALPNAELVVLEGLKHGLVIEAPDRLAQAIRRFVAAQ
jgi:pimeloyl-ACP methyl ester carboxylesterase